MTRKQTVILRSREAATKDPLKLERRSDLILSPEN
jgi:hypothetical protein